MLIELYLKELNSPSIYGSSLMSKRKPVLENKVTVLQLNTDGSLAKPSKIKRHQNGNDLIPYFTLVAFWVWNMEWGRRRSVDLFFHMLQRSQVFFFIMNSEKKNSLTFILWPLSVSVAWQQNTRLSNESMLACPANKLTMHDNKVTL